MQRESEVFSEYRTKYRGHTDAYFLIIHKNQGISIKCNRSISLFLAQIHSEFLWCTVYCICSIVDHLSLIIKSQNVVQCNIIIVIMTPQ
jgi:hypothetical protein